MPTPEAPPLPSATGNSMPTVEAPGAGNSTPVHPWDPGSSSSPSSVAVSAVKMALLAVVVCVSLFGNVLVLLVFQRKPQLLHVANRFVLNLLLADLLQTVLVMPFAIAAAAPAVWPLDARLCRALVVLMHLFAFAGVNTIIVVSVDRYLAIIHPLSYPARMTPHLGTNLIAGTWALSLLQSTPPLYGWGAIAFDRRRGACSVVWAASPSYAVLVAACSFWLPGGIMLACYWMVFRAARRQNALVHPILHTHPPHPNPPPPTPAPPPPPCATSSSSPTSSSVSPPPPPPHPHQAPPPSSSSSSSFSAQGYPVRTRHRRHHQCKAARVVFVIMASYVLSMGPYSVLSTVSMRPGAAVPPWLASLALLLFFLQCCLHPYIYGYMHRSVRKEFLTLLCGPLLCRRPRPPRQSSAVDSCFTVATAAVAAGNSQAHHVIPPVPAAPRARPLLPTSWEEGTATSSSPPATEQGSRHSRKTTSTSLSLETEITTQSQ